jgi:hypothetical protein
MLSILLVLAVGVLQALGAAVGYVCDCAESARLVRQARCDGESCHPATPHHGCAGHDHGELPGGQHEHQVLRDGVDAVSSAPLPEPLPPSAASTFPHLLPSPSRQISVRSFPPAFEPSPPPPLVVARCLVRQV